MKAYDIIGYAIDGALYCTDCANDTSCPLFVDGAEGGEICDQCFWEWFESAKPEHRGPAHIPSYVYLSGEPPPKETYFSDDEDDEVQK